MGAYSINGFVELGKAKESRFDIGNSVNYFDPDRAKRYLPKNYPTKRGKSTDFTGQKGIWVRGKLGGPAFKLGIQPSNLPGIHKTKQFVVPNEIPGPGSYHTEL